MSFGDGFASGYVMGSKIKKNKAGSKGTPTKVDPAVASGEVGVASAPENPSPMEQTKSWIKGKLDSFSSSASPSAEGGSGDVGLVERLKAGNIDDPKSEAYARWGKGNGATVTPVGDASQVSDPEALGPGGTFTSEMWDAAPESGTGANPAWDDLNKNMEA